MVRRFGRHLVLAVMLMAGNHPAFAQTLSTGEPSSDAESKTIVGAWFNTVHPTLRPAVVGLGTFTADGGLINTTSDALAFPTETPGHGRWVRTGRRSYAATFVVLIGASDGSFAAMAKVRANLTLSASGDEFTGVFQIDLFDSAGVPIISDTGTVTGTRVKVEAL
jgi:hypothetical protein